MIAKKKPHKRIKTLAGLNCLKNQKLFLSLQNKIGGQELNTFDECRILVSEKLWLIHSLESCRS